MHPQHNEAAALLENGALYNRRVGLSREGRDVVFAGFKQGAFSLYFGDTPAFHYDLEGRWQRAYFRDRHHIRRLDGAIHEVDREHEDGELVLRRRILPPDESRTMDEVLRVAAADLLADLDREGLERVAPPADKARILDDAELRAFLARIAAWDARAWADFDARFRRVYQPLTFVPPDVPLAVLLQATVGRRDEWVFARCNDRELAARTPEEFDAHVAEVVELLGSRLVQNRSAFLAGADVLRQPAGHVLGYLDVIARRLRNEGGPTVDNVHAFLDGFQKPAIDRETLRQARERRLSRIALGVESGAPEVRRLYDKRWNDSDLQTFAADAKAAGIELSVLTLVGAGGKARGAEHVERTRALIESLQLARGDLVFLMDERELADPACAPGGCEPFDPAEWREQLERLRQGLSTLRARGVKVVPYSMVKQYACH